MAADTSYQPGVVQRRQDGNLHVPTGQSMDFEAGSTLSFGDTALAFTAAQFNQVMAAFGAIAFDRGVKVAKVALAAVDTGGGIFAWANPEAVSILVHRVIVDVTTIATGACLIDIGTTATNATTSSDNLIDGIDIHAATGPLGIADGDGTNGKYQQKLAAGKWVTGSKISGASAGIVGFAYIHYSNI